MVKSFITKEKSEIALMKAIGLIFPRKQFFVFPEQKEMLRTLLLQVQSADIQYILKEQNNRKALLEKLYPDASVYTSGEYISFENRRDNQRGQRRRNNRSCKH